MLRLAEIETMALRVLSGVLAVPHLTKDLDFNECSAGDCTPQRGEALLLILQSASKRDF